jgi:hypothetical protein
MASTACLYASHHHDPEAKAKMQAELDFRASGKQRRYAWDYDETMDIVQFRTEERTSFN